MKNITTYITEKLNKSKIAGFHEITVSHESNIVFGKPQTKYIYDTELFNSNLNYAVSDNTYMDFIFILADDTKDYCGLHWSGAYFDGAENPDYIITQKRGAVDLFVRKKCFYFTNECYSELKVKYGIKASPENGLDVKKIVFVKEDDYTVKIKICI